MSRFDDLGEYRCIRTCSHRGREYRAGAAGETSVVSDDHPVLRQHPDCFERIEEPPENGWSLRGELQLRDEQMRELRKQAAEEKERRRATAARDEKRFWAQTAEFVADTEARMAVGRYELDRLPDPVREAKAEEQAEKTRIAALPDPVSEAERFWDDFEDLKRRARRVSE